MQKCFFGIAATIILLLAVACAPKVGIQRLDQAQRTPNSGKLDIYESADEVGRPYKKIAVLSVTNQKRMREEKGNYEESLYRQAREIGADAVVILERRSRTQRNYDGMGGYFDYTVYQVRAEAIVFE